MMKGGEATFARTVRLIGILPWDTNVQAGFYSGGTGLASYQPLQAGGQSDTCDTAYALLP